VRRRSRAALPVQIIGLAAKLARLVDEPSIVFSKPYFPTTGFNRTDHYAAYLGKELL
jgi:hypothetical protein